MVDDMVLRAVLVAIAGALGPAGFAFLLMACVIGYFYRRDIRLNGAKARGEMDRALAVYERGAVASEKLTEAIDRLREDLQMHETRELQALDRIEHAITLAVSQR